MQNKLNANYLAKCIINVFLLYHFLILFLMNLSIERFWVSSKLHLRLASFSKTLNLNRTETNAGKWYVKQISSVHVLITFHFILHQMQFANCDVMSTTMLHQIYNIEKIFLISIITLGKMNISSANSKWAKIIICHGIPSLPWPITSCPEVTYSFSTKNSADFEIIARAWDVFFSHSTHPFPSFFPLLAGIHWIWNLDLLLIRLLF